jgi:hypothetical protein
MRNISITLLSIGLQVVVVYYYFSYFGLSWLSIITLISLVSLLKEVVHNEVDKTNTKKPNFQERLKQKEEERK